MRILQITPNAGWGGGEKYVYELSESLPKAGHEVYTVIQPCDIQRDRFAFLPHEVINFRGPADPLAIMRLAKLMKAQQTEIVHVHIFKHAVAAALARKWSGVNAKIVMTRHLSLPCKNKPYYPWLMREIDKLIFVAEKTKEVFLSTAPSVDPDKLIVIHNSIRPELTEEVERIDDSRLLIGFAGTLNEHKGIPFLTRVAEELKRREAPIRILVAGRGKEEFVEPIRQRIREQELGDYIEMIGFLRNGVSFFKSVDMAIVPSMWLEAFPLVILEAMAAGKAILWSEHIPQEVMDDGIEGVMIDVLDPAGTAERMIEIAADREKIRFWSENSLRRFNEQYAYPVFLERITDVYREVLTPAELLEHPPLD